VARAPQRWIEVPPSQFTHEAEGLNLIRALLPQRDPFRAWSNFEFRDGHGKWHEVDLLVLGERRMHLVALKYYSGTLRADDHTTSPPRSPTRGTDRLGRPAHDAPAPEVVDASPARYPADASADRTGRPVGMPLHRHNGMRWASFSGESSARCPSRHQVDGATRCRCVLCRLPLVN
jgi:hypothetical protein